VVLSILAKSGKSMSQLIAPLARYPQSGEINFSIEDKDGALAWVRKEYGSPSRGATIDELDGVTVDCFAKHGWWCNIRKSNTEPLLRLNLEARDEATLQRMMAEISPRLGKKVDH
jgi:phosphomannomutase